MRSQWAAFVVGMVVLAGSSFAMDIQQSTFDQDLQQMRFSVAASQLSEEPLLQQDGGNSGGGKEYSRKSPAKAFLLSALVPGLGQYYYGSRVKPWLFFGADVAAWALYFKWNGDGNDLEDGFEAFQRAHWSRDDYREYLLEAYGAGDDDSIDAQEISHHLPETETGQYFEMTGKYDQFAWGWDDAIRNDMTLDEWLLLDPGEELAIKGKQTAPYSANRLTYVDMRDDANKKFDQARAMIMVAIANRLISGFEAYFTTKSRNDKAGIPDEEFSQLSLEASLKSYNTKRDTPFLTATYKF